MILAVLVLLVPPLAFGASWTDWLYRALVLLVIGCPCALVISTPVTVVSGLAAAARQGILGKGGVHLENGRLIKVVALDKTGSYWSAAAFRGTTWMSTSSSTTTRQVLQINVLSKKKPRNNTAEAARIARLALKAYPAARNLDAITITITHGYDIGIWSMWQSAGEAKSPAEWDESDEN